MNDGADGEALFTSGVLAAADGVATTSADFESAVDGYLDEVAGLDRGGLADLVGGRVDRPAVVDPLAALGAEDPRTVAELCALADFLTTEPTPEGDDAGRSSADAGGPPRDWLSLLPVLRLFRPVETPTEGVPDPFVPVPAAHVPHLTRVFSPAVVYVWLDDCDPCETVKADLESVFESPREVMPFAVYGPDHREFLAEEYEVTAGPVVLFVRDGAVDSRLYGAQGPRSIETELDVLRESTPRPAR
ncbi:thioredoxin family protein [Halorarum salinum]|uniref:Thioredoxin family protein n=1 Tax=Halorarum salinum TaxID=2743089 RepID=A0A7D5LDK2_9EURY|nr:thioredoxin family protein [Halobaculum salinum]QLG64151.1 thioredoxin family protein [Halobaculum salinum]